MQQDPQALTFAFFATVGGIAVAAPLITMLVELVKRFLVGPSGALLAFAASAILYVGVFLFGGPVEADRGLQVFVAWLLCATSAVGVHSAVRHGAEEAGVIPKKR